METQVDSGAPQGPIRAEWIDTFDHTFEVDQEMHLEDIKASPKSLYYMALNAARSKLPSHRNEINHVTFQLTSSEKTSGGQREINMKICAYHRF